MKRAALGCSKMIDLAERLGIRRWGAVGLLESLWWFASREAPHGDLARFSAKAIARQLDWTGNPDRLIDALVESRWLDRVDGMLLVHDWHEHADSEVQRKVARSGKPFASGFLPSFARLTKEERELAAKAFGESAVRPPCALRAPAVRPSQSQSQSQHQGQGQHQYQSQLARAPEGRREETEPAAEGDELDVFLSPLRRLYPAAKWNEAETREALAVVLAEESASEDPPTPEGLAASLAAWKMSSDWSDQGGRFVPPSRTWVLRRDFRKAPRRSRDPALDPGGWKLRQLVADALKPTETAA